MSGRHLYVACEGADGAGKSTVLDAVARALRDAGEPATRVRQHAWLDAAAARVLLDVRHERRGRATGEILEAYRRDHEVLLRAVVRPALAHGTVLQDRGRLSSAVHPAVLAGASLPQALAAMAGAGGPFPDVVVLVDVAPREALARIAARGKAVRAWERPDRLRAAVEAHRAAFAAYPWPAGTACVRLHNASGAGWRERIERAVVDTVLARLRDASAPVTPRRQAAAGG